MASKRPASVRSAPARQPAAEPAVARVLAAHREALERLATSLQRRIVRSDLDPGAPRPARSLALFGALQRLATSAELGLVVTDGGMIVEANRTFLDLVGYTETDVVDGIAWEQVASAEGSAQIVRELRDRGSCAAFECECRSRDGDRIPALVTAVRLDPFPDSQLRSLCLVFDRRGQRRSDEDSARELESARREAERTALAREELLAAVGHDLRGPLTPIRFWAKMLQHGRVATADLPRVGEAIDKAARSMTRLIDDLLDATRIATGGLTVQRARVELSAVIHAAVDMIQPDARAKRITLKSRVGADLTVFGDRDRLQQVMWNLLSNAVKFTPAKGKVSVVAVALADDVVVRVCDSGQGIEPRFLRKIFEPFEQAGGSRTKRRGLGLGLSIVRRLVELHGGVVYAESPGRNRGTTFTVRLRRTDPSHA